MATTLIQFVDEALVWVRRQCGFVFVLVLDIGMGRNVLVEKFLVHNVADIFGTVCRNNDGVVDGTEMAANFFDDARANLVEDKAAFDLLHFVRQRSMARFLHRPHLFEIMGGLGSMKLWEKEGMAAKDKVHFTHKGYVLIGDLFYNALINAYLEKNNKE